MWHRGGDYWAEQADRWAEMVAVQLGSCRTVLVSCKGYEPHRVFNNWHRRTENWPESPSWWAPVVNSEMQLACVTFAVGTRWSALRVGLGVGEGWDGCWCWNEKGRERQDEAGTELNDCGINWLSTYPLCLYVLWALRWTCSTVLMWTGWLCDICWSSRSSSQQSGARQMGQGRPVGYSQHWSRPRQNQLGTPSKRW